MLTSLTLALTLAAGPAPARDAAFQLSAKAEQALQAQATGMLEAWKRGDDEEFVKSLYPGLVQELGGRERALESIRATRADFEKIELQTSAATVGKVRACVRVEKDIQCAFEGTQVMRAPKLRVTAPTVTVGFSKDGGETWTFLAISSDGDVRETFPEVSKALPLALERPKLERDDGDADAKAKPADANVTP